MGRIALLTSVDMSQQTGDVTLIGRRAKAFYSQFHVITTCVIICEQNYTPLTFEGVEYCFAKDDKAIREEIAALKDLDLIILYGRISLTKIDLVINILSTHNSRARIIIDVQGALEESIEYSNGMRKVINCAKYLFKKLIFRAALNKANGAFVVSDELAEYCRNYLRESRINLFRIYKVRCGVDNILDRKRKMHWRSEVRKEFNIEDDSNVFVFSGYRMAWQKIDEMIYKFQEYDRHDDSCFFAFYCNLDSEFEKRIEKCFPKGNYVLKHLSSDEYFKYLCGCDVGFLLRDYNTTNRVAFPNKFSDYLNAGLVVATNRAIPEPIRILQSADIDYIDLELVDIQSIFKKLELRRCNLDQFYQRTETLCERELLYSNQISKLDLWM